MDQLGEFLQSRRAMLRPETVGLTAYGERRRVPGLRREELAQLAGVSVSYYTRLEQGQSQNASDEVIDALARALRLTDEERSHLHAVARPPAKRVRRAPRPEQVRPGLVRLIEAMGDVPAVILGRWGDVLAWNRLGHAFLAGHIPCDSVHRPADRPNKLRMLFLDEHVRDLYVDWKGKAREAVAFLRLLAGRYPDDPRLTALVGELTVKSKEFATLWAAHPVSDCAPAVRDFRHPLVGHLTLSQEVLRSDPTDQLFITYTAAPGSPSEGALRLLASLSAGTAGAGVCAVR